MIYFSENQQKIVDALKTVNNMTNETENKEQTDEISEHNLKMWEEIFKAESEDKG